MMFYVFFLDSLVESSDPSDHDYTKIDIIKEGRSHQWHNWTEVNIS